MLTGTAVDNGTYEVSIRAFDGTLAAVQGYLITVDAANHAPIISDATNLTATEGLLYTFTPTVTDANVLLGYLDPADFLAGAMTLNLEAAEEANMGAFEVQEEEDEVEEESQKQNLEKIK